MPEEEPLPDNPFKRKAEEERRRRKAEAEVKAAEAEAKAKAKKAAKKKANQAPEDDWFQDGPKGGDGPADADSDDDMGFRMFSKDDLETAPIDKAQVKSTGFKPMKVKNLIDFSECDVPEEEEIHPPPAPADAGGGAPPAPSLAPSAALGSGPPPLGAASLAVPMGAGTGNSPRPSLSRANTADQTFFDNRAQQESNYMAEIEHLQQMLRDANEEKMISVAIIQDDVEDKKQIIVDLTRKQAESEVELQIARDRIKELEVQQAPAPAHVDESNAFPDHWGAMGKSITECTVVEPQGSDPASALALATAMEDAEELRVEVARLQGEVESKTQALQEKDALKAEVEKLRAAGAREVPGVAPGQEDLKAEVGKLQAEARAHKEALLCAERARAEAGVEAERCRKEAEEAKRAANEQAVAVSTEKVPSSAVSNQLPPGAAVLLLEVHDLCERARQSLGVGGEGFPQQASTNADADAKMRSLRDAVAALQVSAEQAAAERKRLVTKAEDLERANAGAVSKSLQSALEPAPLILPAASAAGTNGMAGSPLPNDDEALRAEAQAAAEVLGKHAAQALREVRLNAERQLAWISKRINMKVDLAAGGAPGAALGTHGHGAGASPMSQADAGT